MSTVPSSSSPPSPSTQHPDREHCTCDHCGDEYLLGDGYSRRFCSPACRYRGAAHGILEALKYDHTHCASCFRQLKEVFHPGDYYITQTNDLEKTPECFVGLESALPGHEWGIGESFAGKYDDGVRVGVEPVGEKSTMVCECGVAHHRTVAFGGAANFKENLSKNELTTRADRLVAYAESEQGWSVDRDVLFDTLRELKDQLPNNGRDWGLLKHALAAGLRVAQ